MSHQKRHIRRSKFGRRFVAGRKVRFIPGVGMIYKSGARISHMSNEGKFSDGTFIKYHETPWWLVVRFDDVGREEIIHSTRVFPIRK